VLLDLFGRVEAKDILETERERLQSRVIEEQVYGRRSKKGTSV
jgi:hypothetical protein